MEFPAAIDHFRRFLIRVVKVIYRQLLNFDLEREHDEWHRPSAGNHLSNQQCCMGMIRRAAGRYTGGRSHNSHLPAPQEGLDELSELLTEWEQFVSSQLEELDRDAVSPEDSIRQQKRHLLSAAQQVRKLVERLPDMQQSSVGLQAEKNALNVGERDAIVPQRPAEYPTSQSEVSSGLESASVRGPRKASEGETEDDS